MNRFAKAVLFLASMAGVARAQELEYLNPPVESWRASFQGMGDGNAASVSPDGSIVYASSAIGQVGIMDAGTGAVTKIYSPPQNADLSTTCTSGFDFGSSDALGDFLVYAVIDGAFSPAAGTFCRVIGLSHPAGDELFVSEPLPGVCSGTPKIGTDSTYIYMNSNSGLGPTESGHFNIITPDGAIFYTSTQGTDATYPFSPLEIYRQPIQGAYEAGLGNRNDIVVWASTQRTTETGAYTGATHGFQFPLDPLAELSILTFLPNTDPDLNLPGPLWQSLSAPALGNGGLNAYWAVSRSEFRAWVGAPGQMRTYFDKRATASNREGPFPSPRWPAGAASPVLNSDETLVCAPLNSFFFNCMDAITLVNNWQNPTNTQVLTKAVITPDDSRVYYAEQGGTLYSALTADGTLFFEFPLGAFISSEFSLSPNGATLYYGDNTGFVVALTVATAAPTASPSEMPSEMPSSMPSREPSPPTLFPSVVPSVSLSPSGVETMPAPSAEPTADSATLAPVAGTPAPVAGTPAPVAGTPAPVADTYPPTEAPSGAASMSAFSVLAAAVAAVMFI